MTYILTPHFNVGLGMQLPKKECRRHESQMRHPYLSLRLLKDIRLLKIDIKCL